MKKILSFVLVAFCLCIFEVKAQNDSFNYDKCVLMEEFTTEGCPNCPPIAKLVEQVMEDPQYKDKVIAVTHHAGFGKDFLTNDAALNLRWFYNDKTCYAPALMFDRYPFFYNRSETNRKKCATNCVTTLSGFKEYIDDRLSKESQIAFNFSANYDGSSKLTVDIKGEQKSVFTERDLRIWVYLIENNIKPQNQKNAYEGYLHQHVLRSYNEVWGDLMKWQGDKFEYSCTLDVKDNFNKDNLEIVVFVSDFNADDPTQCVIENARKMSFSTVLGINDAKASENNVKTVEYYTLDGMKVNPDAKGMYIQKKTLSDGDIITKKIMR